IGEGQADEVEFLAALDVPEKCAEDGSQGLNRRAGRLDAGRAGVIPDDGGVENLAKLLLKSRLQLGFAGKLAEFGKCEEVGVRLAVQGQDQDQQGKQEARAHIKYQTVCHSSYSSYFSFGSLLYSRPRYDFLSPSRPIYASNLSWNWRVSHLNT